jgi:hypothetical protein
MHNEVVLLRLVQLLAAVRQKHSKIYRLFARNKVSANKKNKGMANSQPLLEDYF